MTIEKKYRIDNHPKLSIMKKLCKFKATKEKGIMLR